MLRTYAPRMHEGLYSRRATLQELGSLQLTLVFGNSIA